MKTAIFFTSIILISFTSIGQSRLDNWPVESFSSVSIETQLSDLEFKNFISLDSKIIKMVYDHLKNIELKSIDHSTKVATQDKDDWNFIIKFQEWQDEFRIYDGQAMVGKSNYTISKEVSNKFSYFYKRLVSIK